MAKKRINKKRARGAKCPFYRYETRRSICCEGVREGSVISSHFLDEEECKAYRGEFCNRLPGYEQCELYQVIMKKYGEE